LHVHSKITSLIYDFIGLLHKAPNDPIPTQTLGQLVTAEIIKDFNSMIRRMQNYGEPKQFLQDTLYATLHDFVLKYPDTPLIDTSAIDCSNVPADQGGVNFDDGITQLARRVKNLSEKLLNFQQFVEIAAARAKKPTTSVEKEFVMWLDAEKVSDFTQELRTKAGSVERLLQGCLKNRDTLAAAHVVEGVRNLSGEVGIFVQSDKIRPILENDHTSRWLTIIPNDRTIVENPRTLLDGWWNFFREILENPDSFLDGTIYEELCRAQAQSPLNSNLHPQPQAQGYATSVCCPQLQYYAVVGPLIAMTAQPALPLPTNKTYAKDQDSGNGDESPLTRAGYR